MRAARGNRCGCGMAMKRIAASVSTKSQKWCMYAWGASSLLRTVVRVNSDDTIGAIREDCPVKKERRALLTALVATAGSALLPGSSAATEQATTSDQSAKEKVTGIGGLFFRAHDPKALEQWYRDHLGIPVTPQSLNDPVWKQEAGQTLFSAFPESTKYFGDST